MSIVLQSLPFVLIGVFASVLVQQFLKGEVVARWLPRRPLAAVVVSSLFGLVAPVCDCGAIPLGRRMISKGVPVYAAVSFLLAAPVINPVVLFSTALAFQGNATVVVLRMGMTLSVALLVGLLGSRLFADAKLALPTVAAYAANDEKDHGPDRRLYQVVSHATTEYFDVVFFVVLGALFTAVSQTFVPRGDLITLGSHGIGSIAALMPVATILSICSEADAFVARAFASTFSLGAVLAFMTIGQLVDVRNGPLLWRTLGSRVTLLVVLAAYPSIFFESVLINWVAGRA